MLKGILGIFGWSLICFVLFISYFFWSYFEFDDLLHLISGVLRKPVFLSGFPPTLTHKVDDIVDLSCTFDGSPRPEICWYFNQQPITSTNRTRVKLLDGNLRLRIRRLNFEDAGVYSCIVKNEAGEIEKSCTLTVESRYIFTFNCLYTCWLPFLLNYLKST